MQAHCCVRGARATALRQRHVFYCADVKGGEVGSPDGHRWSHNAFCPVVSDTLDVVTVILDIRVLAGPNPMSPDRQSDCLWPQPGIRTSRHATSLSRRLGGRTGAQRR